MSGACPANIGFPAIQLPHTGVTELHLLPQIIFPCSGSISSLTIYANHTASPVKVAIVRWGDEQMTTVDIVDIITADIPSTGQVTITSFGNEEHTVQAGDFVAVLADNEMPSPLHYMTSQDTMYLGNHAELVFTVPGTHSVKIGDRLQNSAGNLWMEDRKVFALSFDITSKDDFQTTGK